MRGSDAGEADEVGPLSHGTQAAADVLFDAEDWARRGFIGRA